MEKLNFAYELKCSLLSPRPCATSSARSCSMRSIVCGGSISAMDELRDAVHLRAYGQKDPLIEYKNEAYEMFTETVEQHQGRSCTICFGRRATCRFRQFLSPAPHAPARAAAPMAMGAATSAGGANCRGWRTQPSIRSLHRDASAEDRPYDPCPGTAEEVQNCCGRGAV